MPEEVLVEIPERISVGPLFLGFVALMGLLVLDIFDRSIILEWVVSIGWIFLFIFLLAKIAEKQSRAGPAVAQFRRRMAQAWVSMDGDELVVRTSKRVEGYKPSRMEWRTMRSFAVVEGETSFELVFPSPADATMFATRIKENLPGIPEVLMPTSFGSS